MVEARGVFRRKAPIASLCSLLGGSENNQTANTETPTSDSERNLNAALSAVTGQKTPLQQSENGDIINSRGEENGSNNPELLEGRKVSTTGRGKNRVRTHGANTEIIRRELADVPQSKGNDALALAAGESAWLSERNLQPASQVGGGLEENFLRSLQRVKSNGYDSIGRVLDADLQEKVSDTVFKYEDGTVFSFFHWTPNEFETFKYGDGAFHCGTLMSALAVKNRSETNGILKEMYVISKNPFVMRDEGAFGPYSVALQLKEFGIINDKELAKISELKGFWSNGYETEACEYVRELLKSLGYDSYFYQNIHEDTGSWSVGVFDADQIITIAENGVLKPNCGVSEATSNNEAAFSMPENGADEDRAVFTTPSEKEIYREPSSDEKVAAMLGKMKSTVQRQVEAVAGDFGIKMIWSEKITVDDGIYDPVNRTITLNPNTTLSDAYIFLFKHEFVHSLEIKKGYVGYKDYLYKSSIAFEEYIRNELKESFGIDFEGTRQEGIDKYVELYWDKRRNAETIPKSIRDAYTRESIEREIVADFVADNLLGAKDGVQDFSKVEVALSEMANTHRNIFQKIIDFIKDWITKLKGAPQNRTLVEDLEYLNRRLMRVYDSAINKKAANDSGVKHSIVNLDSGKSYVRASRKIVYGENVAEWRKQISNFFNTSLKNGPIKITTIEGDTLTISKETAEKARDRNVTENGVTRRLTNNEFLVKLHAESHIDELAEISTSNKDKTGNKKIVSDAKRHDIAKDGFTYRTVYFQDFDNSYYRITLSVGENNGISTVYNVGKIKADNIPNGNIVSAIGSKADMLSADNRLTQKPPTVNTNSTQEAEKNSDNTENLSGTEQHAVRKRRVKIEDPQSFAKKLLRRNRSSQDAQTVERQIQSVVDRRPLF